LLKAGGDKAKYGFRDELSQNKLQINLPAGRIKLPSRQLRQLPRLVAEWPQVEDKDPKRTLVFTAAEGDRDKHFRMILMNIR